MAGGGGGGVAGLAAVIGVFTGGFESEVDVVVDVDVSLLDLDNAPTIW